MVEPILLITTFPLSLGNAASTRSATAFASSYSGAEGVGKSTKATVVAGMTSILIGGFTLSKLLLV